MSQIVADCPRCGAAKTSFDVLAAITVAVHYDWQRIYEVFAVCRHCNRATILVLAEKGIDEKRFIEKNGLVKMERGLNDLVRIEGFISLKDSTGRDPPDHLPEEIEAVFSEGATSLATGCYNAAGTMFRLCVDLATRGLLPDDDHSGLNKAIRRSLGLRLDWMFNNGLLPESLRELSRSVKEDGNDGAHAGTLTREDAEDLLDFTVLLLERLYTEPERLRIAQVRRLQRRSRDE